MNIKIIFTDWTYTLLDNASMSDIEYLLRDETRKVKLIKQIWKNE